MTRLAHRQNGAEGVVATGIQPMDFPRPAQHSITPARVVGATLHRAFALATGPVVNIISKSQVLSPPF